MLQIKYFKGDYKELPELSIIFSNFDLDKKIKINSSTSERCRTIIQSLSNDLTSNPTKRVNISLNNIGEYLFLLILTIYNLLQLHNRLT